MEVGSADFPNARSAMDSPLAKALYGIDGKTVVAINLQVCIVILFLRFNENDCLHVCVFKISAYENVTLDF